MTKAVQGLEDNKKCIFNEVKEMIKVNDAHIATLLQASATKTHSATQEFLQASSTMTQAETKTILEQALGLVEDRLTSTTTLLAKAYGQVEERDDALQKRITDFERRLVSVEFISPATANDCDDEFATGPMQFLSQHFC